MLHVIERLYTTVIAWIIECVHLYTGYRVPCVVIVVIVSLFPFFSLSFIDE